MNEYNNNDESPPDLLIIPSRDVVISCLEDCRRDLHHKVTTGRIRDLELERARNEKMRLLIYACSTLLQVLKDRDLDAIASRLEQVEANQQEQERARRVHRYSEPAYYDPCTIAGGK